MHFFILFILCNWAESKTRFFRTILADRVMCAGSLLSVGEWLSLGISSRIIFLRCLHGQCVLEIL